MRRVSLRRVGTTVAATALATGGALAVGTGPASAAPSQLFFSENPGLYLATPPRRTSAT